MATRIGFIVVGPPNIASARLQGYLVSDWLDRNTEISSSVINLPSQYEANLSRRDFFRILHASLRGLHAVVFQKVAGPYARRAMRMCNKLGIKVVFIDCDLRASYPFSQFVDRFVAPSAALARDIEAKSGRGVTIIPDPVEFWRHPSEVETPAISGKIKAVWVGSHTNFDQVLSIKRELLQVTDLRMTISTISDHPLADIPWRLGTIKQDILAFDVGLLPVPNIGSSLYKSHNRATLFMALSMPLVVSRSNAYQDLVHDRVNAFVFDDVGELPKICDDIRETALRKRVVNRAFKDVKGYHIDAIGMAWAELVNDLCAKKRGFHATH